MDKEIAGQPLWIWLVGAAVVVGGYLYITHKSSSAKSGGSGTGNVAAPSKDTSSSSFRETIKDLHSPPRKKA